MRRAWMAAAMIAITTPVARAQDVFNNGQAWDGLFAEYSMTMGYDDFFLTKRSHITAIRYYAAWWRDVEPNPYLGYTGLTTWAFFLDLNGSPGTQVAGGVTAGTWQPGVGGDNLDGHGLCGGEGAGLAPCTEHRLPIDLYLKKGNYWLGLMNGTEPSFDNSWYYWASSITREGGAFALEGNVAPEPTTLVLLATGVAGLAGVRRRRA